MLFFELFPMIQYPFFLVGAPDGGSVTYSSIGLTNDLKQEKAYRLSLPNNRFITPNTFCSLCLLRRRRVYPKTDRSYCDP